MIAPTIVYDLDGTLADTAGDLVAALNWLLGREGLAPLPVENAGSLLGAGARALIQRGFAARAGRSIRKRWKRCSAVFSPITTPISPTTRGFIRASTSALAAFARAGWRLAVCTNKIEGSAKLLIEKLGVADRFAFVCGQDTFGVAKPDPKPLLETIAASGGASERAIMVGNSATDIKTARAAGLPVIAVDFGYTDVPVAELGPDRVISHFDELEAACGALLGAYAKTVARWLPPLLDCQILFKIRAGESGLRLAEGDHSLALWDFHDLLFHPAAPKAGTPIPWAEPIRVSGIIAAAAGGAAELAWKDDRSAARSRQGVRRRSRRSQSSCANAIRRAASTTGDRSRSPSSSQFLEGTARVQSRWTDTSSTSMKALWSLHHEAVSVGGRCYGRALSGRQLMRRACTRLLSLRRRRPRAHADRRPHG